MDSNGLADPYVKLHLLPGASKVPRGLRPGRHPRPERRTCSRAAPLPGVGAEPMLWLRRSWEGLQGHEEHSVSSREFQAMGVLLGHQKAPSQLLPGTQTSFN